MLTFNHSHDGGNFEEETAIQKFKRYHELSCQALFQVEFYISFQNKAMAKRYLNLMNYIENKMRTINYNA